MNKVVLMDVEGTTTSIDFVHKVLFPYAREHLAEFIHGHHDTPAVQAQLEAARHTVAAEGGSARSLQDIVDALTHWIAQDRKHPALKALQGMVWRKGYEDGVYTAHIYADVLPCWRRWRTRGLILAIYSSGSIQAQKLLFSHTEQGDLTPLLSHYFDTGSGPKKEAASYANIAQALKVAPNEVLFLSDVAAELDAARAASMRTTQLVRPGTAPCETHPTVRDFNELNLSR